MFIIFFTFSDLTLLISVPSQSNTKWKDSKDQTNNNESLCWRVGDIEHTELLFEIGLINWWLVIKAFTDAIEIYSNDVFNFEQVLLVDP